MNYSYWELKEWFSSIDFTIVGSGIVGLHCALALQEKYPSAKIIILEKGILPQGASTKNAGFACFGSLSELIDDLNSHSEEEVFQLVEKRWKGLQILRKTLGDAVIDYQQNNGYELCETQEFFEKCMAQKDSINRLLHPIFKKNVFSETNNIFDFNNIHNKYIVNHFEGQIDTGKMAAALLQKVQQKGIKIVNGIEVTSFLEDATKVAVKTNRLDFYTNKLCIATNGFASELLKEKVHPARAQVVITSPIKDLQIKGTFHLDKGYYYFRNIDNRILLGGGRNLDFKGEETTTFGQSTSIQQKLEQLLKEVILPNHSYSIEHRWSGIMGVGNQKNAIVKLLSNRVYCGVRLGGMGVAIGSLVGKELADLAS